MEQTTISELKELRAKLFQLTNYRASVIETAREMVAEANREFDSQATVINRRIKALAPRDDSAPPLPPPRARPRRARTVKVEGTEGWTEEDIQHYRELQVKQL